jgi:pyridoxine kinase
MKRVVTIQDISCFGKCSLTVALPLISAMGIECAIIPTAVLSTHTGGFTGFTFTDLTEDIPKISDHWGKYDLKFDTIYTGYLGSTKQIDYVIDFIEKFKGESTLVCIDPAMADKGKLYTGFDSDFPSHMARLCAKADIIVPNITEAAFMTGMEYKDTYDETYVKAMLKKLSDLGAKISILTGVSFEEGKTGVMGYDKAKDEFYYYSHDRHTTSFHGTGDIFSSTCVGALMNGLDWKKAIEVAANYTSECIRVTLLDPSEPWYGVNFEQAIPFLLKELNK